MYDDFYVYLYLREDQTPYYVGKGRRHRYLKKHTVAVPPPDRIKFVAKNLFNHEAMLLEKRLIALYGRQDLGTGILRNQTTGGEGSVPGPAVRAKLSAAKKGQRPNNYGKTFKCKVDTGARSKAKAGANHPYYGVQRTEEERQRISNGLKLVWDRAIQTCPHCGKQGKQNMSRWHFDNCRNKLESNVIQMNSINKNTAG